MHSISYVLHHKVADIQLLDMSLLAGTFPKIIYVVAQSKM